MAVVNVYKREDLVFLRKCGECDTLIADVDRTPAFPRSWHHPGPDRIPSHFQFRAFNPHSTVFRLGGPGSGFRRSPAFGHSGGRCGLFLEGFMGIGLARKRSPKKE